MYEIEKKYRVIENLSLVFRMLFGFGLGYTIAVFCTGGWYMVAFGAALVVVILMSLASYVFIGRAKDKEIERYRKYEHV